LEQLCLQAFVSEDMQPYLGALREAVGDIGDNCTKAAYAFAGSSLRTMIRHTLANVGMINSVVSFIGLGTLVLIEASLRFLRLSCRITFDFRWHG